MRLTKKQIRMLRRSAVALIALSGSQMNIAYAQTADSIAPAASDKTEVVVVTARRREETLQDVPVSVTAFTADTLSKQGVPDVTALTFALPNTTMKASRATNTTLTAFIRGVGQQDPLAGFESGVGIYLDDIYLARPQGAVADIYDVERIEVLRGPQGTLYGRNTIGGAVKYVTRKLAPKTDVRLKGTLGNYGQVDSIVTASTPVTDMMRVGGTFAVFKRDGFGKNLTTGNENYNKDLTAARLSAEFTPTSDIFIRLSGDVTNDISDPKNGHRLTPGRTSGAPVLSNVYDSRGGLTRAQGNDQEVKQHGWAGLVEWTVSPQLTFKSVTSSRKDKSWAPIDFDSLAAVDFEVPALYKNKQFSQEFQFTYTGDKVQGVAGVYYIDANAFNKFDTILAGAFPSSTYTMGSVDTKATAFFADANYEISDTLNVAIGGRYTIDERKAKVLRQIYLGLGGTPGLGNATAVLFRTDTDFTNGELVREDKKFTPRISLGWKVDKDHNVYGSFGRGFKGGGFDPRMNVVGTKISLAQAKAGYNPEVIDTLELGLKSSFHNNRVLTNIALFNSDYKDVQIPGSVAVDTNGDGKDDSFAGVTTNAGKAKIKGFELEATARITDQFSVSGMYSYIDARYTEFLVAGVNQAANRVFQNTPRNSANIRANYDIPMEMMGNNGTLSLSASASHRSKTHQFETPTILDQNAYDIVDASAVWTRKDGKVRFGLHGRNLGDTQYKTAGYNFPTLGFEGVLTAFYGPPRTVSATVEYRF
jgi:iron complex outermembrane receptor protein